jgi:CRISPR-associated protein Cas2
VNVFVVESVSPRLRGHLTRWLLEPKAGVFVGRLSAQVRDLLWDHVCKECGEGGAVLVHASSSEQGFSVRTWGRTRRIVDDFDGLQLIRRPFEADQ